jgi:hypothetical protein
VFTQLLTELKENLIEIIPQTRCSFGANSLSLMTLPHGGNENQLAAMSIETKKSFSWKLFKQNLFFQFN